MNKYTTPIPSTLLRNKLAKAIIRLQQQADPLGNNTDYNTLEKAMVEALKLVSRFYQTITGPTYVPVPQLADTVPQADDYNQNFQDISDDLEVVFTEFENLETVVLSEFNYMVSRLNRLNRKLKAASSSLGDFILFSDLATKDAIFYADSFNNLYRVEVNTPLLSEEQCEINQVEGIATLPVDREAQQTINVTEVPVINSNSNGVRGNNQQANTQVHSNISDVLDNNADTWFEYERVVSTDDGVPLTLDFTINLGKARIINFVRVNPNNFGTRTQVEILAIDTSIDGKDFVSIKDDIPIADFTVEDEENVFALAPSTSKYAGQGLYSFTPRKAKYVHLTLKQTSPYTITTSAGAQKHRYAIGVRDVDIQAIPYKATGELISVNYPIADEVRKVVLLANQNPSADTVSTLASIAHHISPDNGVTWYQIRPKVSSGVANTDQTVPELLNFNTVDDDAVATANVVNTLRYRATLIRNTDAFTSEAAELAQKISNKTELHTPPSTTPFEIHLQNTPIDGTLKLIDPQFGSRGKPDARYSIAVGNGNKLLIRLPFSPLKRDLQKVFNSVWTLQDLAPEEIYVDGVLWANGALTGTNKSYRLNYEDGELEFGDGSSGAAVPSGATVSMVLSEERLLPSRGADHIALLDYPTSHDQKQMTVSVLHPAKLTTTALKKGTKRHQLEPDIVASSLSLSPAPAGGEVTFVDGSVEFQSSNQFSVDYTNGVLYLQDASSTSTDMTVVYQYNPRTELTTSQWKFTSVDGGVANAISISDSAFLTFEADPLSVPSSVKYFNLAHLAIVRGSVSFSGSTSGIFDQEVEYIDGRKELLGVVRAAEEIAAITGVTPNETRDIPFKVKISTDTSLPVTFSDTSTFNKLVASRGLVDSGIAGDYYVDRSYGSTGSVYVKLADNVATPGTVTYYYVDPQATLTGRYSISYETGEVFTHDATGAGITVNYEYTNYRAKYDIAREVNSENWSLDTSSNTISLADREVLKNMRTPQVLTQGGGLGASKYYQASYEYVSAVRPDVSELEPYFTPVLKDYALKVLTKSRLI